jgi:hypothetical protein
MEALRRAHAEEGRVQAWMDASPSINPLPWRSQYGSVFPEQTQSLSIKAPEATLP